MSSANIDFRVLVLVLQQTEFHLQAIHFLIALYPVDCSKHSRSLNDTENNVYMCRIYLVYMEYWCTACL
jgi:hypothetical protein